MTEVDAGAKSLAAAKPRDRFVPADGPSSAQNRVPYVFPNRRIKPQTVSRAFPNSLQIDITSKVRRHF